MPYAPMGVERGGGVIRAEKEGEEVPKWLTFCDFQPQESFNVSNLHAGPPILYPYPRRPDHSRLFTGKIYTAGEMLLTTGIVMHAVR